MVGPMKLRGLVWIGLGAAIVAVGLLTPYRLVVRGTHVPWGLVVAGVGLLLLAWDSRRKRPGPPPSQPPSSSNSRTSNQ